MKLLGTTSALALMAVLAFTSCKKYYTCACSTTTTTTVLNMQDSTGNPVYTTTTDTLNSTETYNTTKNDAKDRCSSNTQNYASSDSMKVKRVEDCHLQ